MSRPYVPRDYSQPDPDSGPDDDDDEDEDVKKRAQADLIAFDQSRDFLRASQNFHHQSPNVAQAPDARLAMEADWRQHFCARAAELSSNSSITMVGFNAIYTAIAAENPHIYDEQEERGAQVFNEVFVRTAVFSSQHTPESRIAWPTREEWVHYKHIVAAMMVTYFRSPKAVVANNVLQTHKARPTALDAEFLSRKLPDGLRIELDNIRKQAEKDIKAGKEDVRVEMSEEASGALWRESPEEMCANLPFRAARLIYKVDFDEALLLKYKPWPEEAVRFTPTAYARGKKWVVDKCKMEQPEDVTALFREIANGMFWPLGAETQKFRSRSTVSNVTTSLDVLSSEIGGSLSQYLHDRMLQPMDKLLGTEGVAPMLWDAIFLALFSFHLIQKLKFEWLTRYLFMHPQLPDAIKRMDSPLYKGVADKRPVVVLVCRQYFLHYKKRMIPCGHSLLHAVLHWLHILKRDFTDEDGGVTVEEEDDLSGIVAEFLTSTSIL